MATTITLFDPVPWHQSKVSSITIKAPTSGMLLKYGEPRIVVQTSEGAAYFIEKDDVIRRYIEACVDHDGGVDLVGAMSLRDGKQVKAAVLGFFDQADREIFTSRSGSSSLTSA